MDVFLATHLNWSWRFLSFFGFWLEFFFGSGLSFEFFSPKFLEFFFSLRFSEKICKIMHICYYLLSFSALRALISALFFKIQTCLKTSFGGTSVKNDKIVVLKKFPPTKLKWSWRFLSFFGILLEFFKDFA